jgi:hypothetical protein
MSYLINQLGRFIVLLCCFFSFIDPSFSQSITPSTLNNGGGSGLGMEWSMGESVSIAYFTTSNLSLTTGVLQPLTSFVTGINDFGPTVFGNDIIIGPNPVFSQLHIKAGFNQMGTLSFQLIDAKSALLKTIEAGTIFSNYEKDIVLDTYADGVMYIRVLFKPTNGILKSGIYKIIKL